MIEEEAQQVKSQLEQQLIEAILDSLQNHMEQNAIFLGKKCQIQILIAERLVYERDTEEHRSLLAECYLHENQSYKVFHLLKECKSEYNRYQLAVACFRSKKYKEAEIALIGSNQFALQTTNVPNGGFGHFLLGQIYEQMHRLDDAKNSYYKALDQNPTLWMAFERLSKIGEPVPINKVFIEQKQKLYSSIQLFFYLLNSKNFEFYFLQIYILRNIEILICLLIYTKNQNFKIFIILNSKKIFCVISLHSIFKLRQNPKIWFNYYGILNFKLKSKIFGFQYSCKFQIHQNPKNIVSIFSPKMLFSFQFNKLFAFF